MEIDETLNYLNVGIAINGNKNSKYLVRWALDKFVSEGNAIMKLIHVRSRILGIPMREDALIAYTKEMEWKTNEMLFPYRRMCAKAQVEVDVVVVESEDVAEAIASVVEKSEIRKLVIGASSRGMFSRKANKSHVSSKIAEEAPSFCTVYSVSNKGKLSSVRASDTGSIAGDDISDTLSVVSDTSSFASSSQTDRSSSASSANFSSASLTTQRFRALAMMNQNLFKPRRDLSDRKHARFESLDLDERKDSVDSHASSRTSGFSDRASVLSDPATDTSSSDNQVNINFELEQLRIELRHAKGMYAMAQTETMDASRKLSNLNTRLVGESRKLEEVRSQEEEAREAVREEREKREKARREGRLARLSAEREAGLRAEAEAKAAHDARERAKMAAALSGPAPRFREFSWEEIVEATSSFSEDLKVGMGGYGTVYRCTFHHTPAAVKVIHSDDAYKAAQFRQELKILSKYQHPHILLLIGACPERGCLVYEFMPNGSLEDRLSRKNNTPAIPWPDRFRIAFEVASALAFLHSANPDPVIHRDLKPSNILLDSNLVTKIADLGLATTLGSTSSDSDQTPVGSMSYIDPEYQRSGQVSLESDVYALGVVLLQLLTAKPAIALVHSVETAFTEGRLAEVLDEQAGDWPVDGTRELAEIGLGCAELRRVDRPDLRDRVLPALQRLKEAADKARDSDNDRVKPPPPPSHFICPILKDVMKDPCVASDGYTYDRKAIEAWLETDKVSPMTNSAFSGKTLIPNYTLVSAIMEWKSREHR